MASQEVIVNELLAFIQNAVNDGVMDEVSIRQICRTNFKEEEICSGKALLYQSIGKADQMPSRRRDGGAMSLQDITAVFRDSDPDDIPVFVAKQLSKLPPVSFDHVDVTRLLKDITFLKSSLAEVHSKLEASNNTISDLRAEVESLRHSTSICRSHEAANVECRVARNSPSGVGDLSLTSLGASSVVVTAAGVSSPAAPPSAPAEVIQCTSASTPARAYADAAKKKKGKLSRIQPVLGNLRQPSLKKDRCDEEGFIKVERKKKPASRNQCGTALTGTNHLLRPAIPTTQLYVSRLHHSTKSEEVVEYVRLKTKFTLRVERLESSHGVNFNSFVVRVPTEHLSTFTKEEFWPKGVVFRRFRGRLNGDSRMRHTTPK